MIRSLWRWFRDRDLMSGWFWSTLDTLVLGKELKRAVDQLTRELEAESRRVPPFECLAGDAEVGFVNGPVDEDELHCALIQESPQAWRSGGQA